MQFAKSNGMKCVYVSSGIVHAVLWGSVVYEKFLVCGGCELWSVSIPEQLQQTCPDDAINLGDSNQGFNWPQLALGVS